MRFKFDTGPLSHQLLVGVDYSNYFERTRSASDTSSRPGSVVTTIDIYDPVSTGFAVLPYDLLPEQRNTQLGVYVQDQIRYADRVTLVVGGRHDRAVSETEGSPDKVDKAWTFKVGQIGRAACRERVCQYV